MGGEILHNMNRGYIKLWRRIIDTRIFKNPTLLQIWIYCLVRSSHKEEWISIKTGKGETQVHLLPGQFIWGSKRAGVKTRQKWRSAYNRLKKLESIGNLTTQNMTHFTLVTVNQWELYQMEKQKNGKPVVNQWQTTGKPMVTYKNDKNDKNDKNIPPALQQVKDYISEKKYNIDAEKWYNHYTAVGWKIGKNKMKDWKAAVRTWIKEKPKQDGYAPRKIYK